MATWNDIRKNIAKVLLGGVTAYRWLLPSPQRQKKLDVRRDAQPYSDSDIVMGYVQWAMRAMREAELQAVDSNKKQKETDEGLNLIITPNEFYNGHKMLQMIMMELMIDGNAFILIQPTNAGRPAKLFWIPRHQIRIDDSLTRDLGELYYRWYPNGDGFKSYPVHHSEMLHFTFGMDPQNWRLGLSPLASAYRAVFTDKQAAQHIAQILYNFAGPGMVVSVQDPSMDREDVNDMRDLIAERTQGENVGGVFVTTSKLELVQQVGGYKPSELTLPDTRYFSEERVGVLYNIPPFVVGFGAGLRRSTYNNANTVRKLAWESFMIPALGDITDTLTEQLSPYLDPSTKYRYNVDNVGALQEDKAMKSKRLGQEVRDGLILINEARAELGREPLPEQPEQERPEQETPDESNDD